MKKLQSIAVILGSVAILNGAEIINDGYYPMDKIPEKAEISVPLKRDFEFKLEENISTGYIWQARYNPAEVKVEIDHDMNKKHKNVGSPGHADIEIELLRDKASTVEFYYSRPFEKDAKEVKKLICVVSPAANKKVQTVPTKVTDSSVLPILQDDMCLKLDSMAAAMQITLPIGRDISFELEEDDRNLRFWNIVSLPSPIAEIEIDHEESGLFWQKSYAEIEIEPKKSGSYKLDLVYAKNTPLEKHFSLYITVL